MSRAPHEIKTALSDCPDTAADTSIRDSLTILESLGPLLTKTFCADGSVVPYGEAASFKVKPVDINGWDDLRELLGSLHKNPKRCLIRGRFVGKDKAQAGNKAGTYARTNANFTDQPLHWFMADVDGFEPGFADPVKQPDLAIEEYIEAILPAAFLTCSYYWHLSSSAGAPGKEHILKAHIHFISKTPYTTAQMHAWAKTIGKQIDSAVYRRVQVHYTADPIFEEGREDPVPVRCGFHQGADDFVDLQIGESILETARDTGAGEGGNDQKLLDPSEKDGIIGLFHRTFSAEQVLLEILEGFEQISERRYTWFGGGGTPEGVWVHDDGMHVGSSHNTWPIDGISNLWDLVRIFKFGDLDQDADDFVQMDIDSRPINAKPSNLAMLEWAGKLPELQDAVRGERMAEFGRWQAEITACPDAFTLEATVAPRIREAELTLTERELLAIAYNARLAQVAAKLPIGQVRHLLQPRRDTTISSAPKAGALVVEACDQLGMARLMKNDVFRDAQRRRVAVRANGSWYVFNGRCYDELSSDEKINNEAWRFLAKLTCRDAEGGLSPLFPTKALVSGVVDALRSVLETDIDLPPSWLPGNDGPDPSRLLVMANGILDIETGELLEHTPRLFAVNALPYDYDQTADCPQWLSFLQQVLPGDPEGQQLLQEWFGYCLTPDTCQQKFLMLIGQRRSGKGTVGRILQAVLGGSTNTIGPTLASLSKDFGLQSWIGKLVAVFGDTRSGGREPQTVVERILSIVGEDTLTIDRKHRGEVSVKLPTRIMLLSNEVLRLGDASGALIGRMLVLPFDQTFYSREDVTLEARLRGELPGILNWALAGKRRLAERGRFVQPATGSELLKESSDINSPITAFVERHCEADPMFEINLTDLFDAWQIHCSDENHHAGDKAQFSKNLRAAFPDVKKVRRRAEDGRQGNFCSGLRLNAEMVDRLKPFV